LPEATSGYVSVKGPDGTAQSPKPLEIGPSITDFSPAAAMPGDTITLTGYNLTATKAVNVGAYAARFTVLSDDELIASFAPSVLFQSHPYFTRYDVRCPMGPVTIPPKQNYE
jgi:hypothetical protein